MNFSTAIKMCRIESGISQWELARMVGVNQSMISNIEVERHEPRMNIFLKICSALKIDPRVFL